jgi:maltooligosyltrehalose trehalohydrolase
MTHQTPLPGTLPTGDRPQASNLGAVYLGNGQCQFNLWAPRAQKVEVRLLERGDTDGTQPGRYVPMEPGERGYFRALVEGVEPGDRYFYRLDGEKERPDPASRLQPQGVHKASQVVDTQFAWQDDGWKGVALEDYIVYELHVGTFTEAGTFDAIIPHLDWLKDLGITAIEIMPVAQFPGERNWGYDGVYLFGVQYSYGGVDGLKRLVDACHQRGLSVVLDVVYNHLGPEGNYLWDYGYYFTERYHTPWGAAVNYDDAHSDEVRRFFLENVHYWINEFHIDALRLDAVHAIMDFSAYTFLTEVGELMHREGQRQQRHIYSIAESDLNDTRIIRSREGGGFNLDSQWSDDFHHSVHALLTGERDGYYADFGSIHQLLKAYTEGYVYSGQYSEHRQRRHGNSSRAMPATKFVVCVQNHDQVGNRMLGDRFTSLLSFAGLKMAAGVLLLSPYIPMLFMGEEYGEPAPFQYFVSHSDPNLVEAVRQGRKEEFSSFKWQGEVPDPQSEETFQRSRLDHRLREGGKHAVLFALYKELIHLRTTLAPLKHLHKEQMEVVAFEPQQVLFVRRWHADQEIVMVFNFGEAQPDMVLPVPVGEWRKVFDSADARWQAEAGQSSGSVLPDPLVSAGQGTLPLEAQTFVLFRRLS